MTSPNPPRPVRLFCCCAPKDERFLSALRSHVAPLVRAGRLWIVSTREILLGSCRAEESTRFVEQADVITALLSAHLFAHAETVRHTEQAMRRALSGAALLPIRVRPVDLTETPFCDLESLPRGQQAISDCKHPDRAWVEVVRWLRARFGSFAL